MRTAVYFKRLGAGDRRNSPAPTRASAPFSLAGRSTCRSRFGTPGHTRRPAHCRCRGPRSTYRSLHSRPPYRGARGRSRFLRLYRHHYYSAGRRCRVRRSRLAAAPCPPARRPYSRPRARRAHRAHRAHRGGEGKVRQFGRFGAIYGLPLSASPAALARDPHSALARSVHAWVHACAHDIKVRALSRGD